MIQSLTVTNYLGESLTIPMKNSESSGFILHDMTGLGPPTASVNTSKVATKDGSKYNSARAEERNIVLPMYFTPIPTIEDARHRSYKYFPLKKPVILAFKTDNRECQIVGYVETNEPDICSDREGCQVSIICPNPYFSSIYDTVTSFSGIEAAFEFPFSNEDTLDTTNLLIDSDGNPILDSYDPMIAFGALAAGSPHIEFGKIVVKAENIVRYGGDAESGVQIRIAASATVKNITIYNVDTRGTMHIYHDKLVALTGSGIVKGDEIIITTDKGSRSVTLLRNGKSTNILNAIDPRNDEWFSLSKGDNIFAYTADEGSDYLMFVVDHTTLYEGI